MVADNMASLVSAAGLLHWLKVRLRRLFSGHRSAGYIVLLFLPLLATLHRSVRRRTLHAANYLAGRLGMAPRTARRPPPPVCSSTDQIQRPQLNRHMLHLKTKEECRQGNETIQVWTVELPSRHAEGVLKAIKEAVPGQDLVDLQHLRRFAKHRFLPAHVLGQPDKVKDLHSVSQAWQSKPEVAMQEPTSTAWEWSSPLKTRTNSNPPTLHLLICPVEIVPLSELRNILIQHTPFCSSADSWAYPLQIKEITVPKMSPTSPAQAAAWSAEYWPTFYRKTNPFGAHPSTIARAEDELHFPSGENIGVEEAMALARRAAAATYSQGFGIGPGAVIVEREEGLTQVVAVAGDARFKHSPRVHTVYDANGCQGNVMSHAVMRAIGMVGRKRLRVASQPVSSRAARAERNFANCGLDHDEVARDDFFLDLPVTELERDYFERDNIKPDGYLCLRLEVFLTHEPCVMCSMALVHSRVGRVIFAQRMPETGGLTSEVVSNHTGPSGLGYGLCWRKELNWQFMCWEYEDEGRAEAKPLGRERCDSKGVVDACNEGLNRLDIDNGKADGRGASQPPSSAPAPQPQPPSSPSPPVEPNASFDKPKANGSSLASIHV